MQLTGAAVIGRRNGHKVPTCPKEYQVFVVRKLKTLLKLDDLKITNTLREDTRNTQALHFNVKSVIIFESDMSSELAFTLRQHFPKLV